MDTLFLYFFGDVICRVIPGMVIIALYAKPIFNYADHLLKNSEVSRMLCIFLTAWLIGLTVDIGSFALGNIPLNSLPKMFPSMSHICDELLCKESPGKTDGQNGSAAAKQNESDSQRYERMQLWKFTAEKILCRVMLCISVFTVFVPPKTFHSKWNRFSIYSIIASVVFSGCWVWLKYWSP